MSVLEPEHHLVSLDQHGNQVRVTCTCGYKAMTGASNDPGVLQMFAHALERRHLVLNTQVSF
jgi:hypothetical protein